MAHRQMAKDPATSDEGPTATRDRRNARPPSAQALASRPWHALSAGETVEALVTDRDNGLSHDDHCERLKRYGPNRLPEARRATVLDVFFRQFRNPLIYVLLAAGSVSTLTGHIQDAVFIFAVLLLNAALGTYQEYRAESAAQALKRIMTIRAHVRRGGRECFLDSVDLVPGDIVSVQSGDSVPADIRLIRASGLRTDESLLTGETLPVEKEVDALLDEDTGLGDRTTVIHAGTSVLNGRGKGVVVRTGASTVVGRIAQSLAEKGGEPPLVIRMRRFTRSIAVAILLIIIVMGTAQYLQGQTLTDVFLLAVALAVSAIPEGLPVAITVALSTGSHRMTKRNVIIRRLPAVEGLGACTLIASDKTGTLTENKLKVARIEIPGEPTIEVGGSSQRIEGDFARNGEIIDPHNDEKLCKLIVAGALCNEAHLEETDEGIKGEGDTVDIAFLVLARKAGLDIAKLRECHEEIGSIPFESERRYAASFRRHDGTVRVYVKGAAATVMQMCDGDCRPVEQTEETLAREAYRVLALATGEVNESVARESDEKALRHLTLLGLAGLMDPIRESVPDAVARCRRAGIEVRMITGDHPITAHAIGKELKIAGDDDIIATGRDIRKLGKGDGEREEIDERVRDAPVYARIEPGQKAVIVDDLQKAGHFVAVTGDGVNDAPALRRAHIGVAMGKSGTDVARNAADLILTDDNFASIVNGVEEGRIAYDNVRKVVWLLISTGVAELILFTLSVIFNTPLPLTPVQLLWLNLVTNGIQDVALGFERGEPGVLERSPRAPDERIFNRLMIEEVLVSGAYMGFVCFAVFWFVHLDMKLGLDQSRNIVLLLLVLFENVHAFNVRSETRSVFRVPVTANPLLVGAVVVAQSVHIVSMFIPGWRDVLGIGPVSFIDWMMLLGLAASLMIVTELYKWLRAGDLERRPAKGLRQR